MSDSHTPHIPDAVRRASLRADELAREAGVLNVPPLEAEPEGGNTTVVTEPVVPEPTQGELFEIPPETAGQPPPPQESSPDWEQRYNTLQGKYNSEVPELRGQMRAMQDQLARLSQPRPEPRAEPTPTVLPRRDPLPEDVESYGEDLVHAAQRWAMLALEPELTVLRQRVVQLESGMQQTATMSATQRVDAALDREVPSWRTLNIDQQFIAWLNQVDPFTGVTRKQLADDAYAAGDARRTIAFFQAYTNEHTAVRQPPGTQPVQTGNDPADRLPLADLAVPGRGATASPPTPGAPQRRIWTSADINAFYRAKHKGQWIGREAEADRIEHDLYAAQHEGRIRQ